MKTEKRRSVSDAKSKRFGSTAQVRTNPFELYLTKAKHNITGRTAGKSFDSGNSTVKLKKGNKKQGAKGQTAIQTHGLRSVSRNVAVTNRKKTLLNEYNSRTKNNRLIDHRLGEKDTTMSVEDKMMERMMFERKQSTKVKRRQFNLNDDDDEDGSFGRTMAEAERFEDQEMPETDDTDDILEEQFVSTHHFGGGLLKKVINDDNRDAQQNDVRADRKLQIEDIIAESKQKKYNKQNELDEVRDLTKSLDDKWKEARVRSLVSSAFGEAVNDPPVESYDNLVKMLQFDSKAKASDRLKSEAELAKDARDALELADKKRKMNRMDGNQDATASRGLEMLEPAFDEQEGDEDDDDEVELQDIDLADLQDDLVTVSKDADKKEKTADPSDIPFVIPAPAKRRELDVLFANRTPKEVHTIVSRIMSYHHVSLAEANREKLTTFYKFLLDFLLTKSDSEPVEALHLWNNLTFSLLELFDISQVKGATFTKERLQVLTRLVCRKTKYRIVPSAIYFLRFVTLCYPWSKEGHPVQEALMLLLGKILVNVDMSSRSSVLNALFVASLVTDGVLVTKKYCPELLFFLRKTLANRERQAASPDQSTSPALVSNSFSFQELFGCEGGEVKDKTLSRDDGQRVAHAGIALLEKVVSVYAELPAYTELFGDFDELIKKVKTGGASAAQAEAFGRLVALHRQPRKYLQFSKKPPAPLQLLEPRIDTKFDRSKSAKKTQVKRLLHDKKRSMKGAKRELRRDNHFISTVQLNEQLKKDAVRNKKVKEIFSNLYSQESEHKRLQRLKAKSKI
ncbi:hypothetical protein RvY_13028 [Ramazzottius varieornatus]|uniref:Nucleolar protein 14 n=1 Tax=Ramazzottius varieornatus TaxID=947166 RepID=A0A1D1VLG1_RAMVA|nr:hypothetical protein RvY_13028 [Ramazzottius varieornatus]